MAGEEEFHRVLLCISKGVTSRFHCTLVGQLKEGRNDRLSLGPQGFCCLMQLSTRAEDFVVDALALRSHIGPLLGPIFANPEVRLRDAVGEGGVFSACSPYVVLNTSMCTLDLTDDLQCWLQFESRLLPCCMKQECC